jgi:hypothetical protein
LGTAWRKLTPSAKDHFPALTARRLADLEEPQRVGVRLNEVIKATSLDLIVTRASAFGPSSSPIPKRSTER